MSRGGTGRTAILLALAAFLLVAASGGGRVVGSDEVTMLALSRALLRGGIAVPEGATQPGPDGRAYTKNAAGQAVLALPLVAAAEGAASALRLGPAKRTLAVRFGASFFNAFVTALLLGALYRGARALGAGTGAALGAAALLGFTTPVWVYAKSFMAEPLQALGLLLALVASSLAPAAPPRARIRLAWLAGAGVFLAISAKLTMIVLALACLVPLLGAPLSAWVPPLLGIALALAGHAVYDVARFGNPFQTGYGAQASPAALTTPLLVGLYGLLLSSGKGVVWFAPALWLAPRGWRAATRRAGRDQTHAHSAWVPRWGELTPAGRAAWGALVVGIAALALYAKFQHWAGDGSFGPRYLVPVLPPGMLLVAFALHRASRAMRRAAWILGLLGLFVTLGGVGIYFGAEMREVGDYPYRLALDDPRFMSDSHFNPRFSPIAGHWRMLARNLGEHLRGEMPRLTGEVAPEARLGLNEADQAALLHALDFWWLYARYAGVPAAPVLAALGLVLALAALALAGLVSAWRAESRAG
ncbi:MAG TPA: hypothetical protein VMS88_02825 [Terriglobales bacterium]|nr:hypothetical protein [Terriglobales bacterium]